MAFTYSSGQKPLAGYTIKHGIGKGAFGEVYFGLSDGGKEVALKLIRANADVEKRGIEQCLNLKHANLVHLYDLRTDEHGDYWLVMEHVAGDSLRTIIDRQPRGLPADVAVDWLQGLAAGVQHLHDHGIVHRDLKPGNVFIEKGTVKVGDFSLCKLLDSRQVGQTQSVGTVHYMAPEISTGNYNRQIDVYAAGIIFYEMLSGKVPFNGDSVGEILMKHLTSMPDLTKVPSRFVPLLDQALCKNPARRIATMADLSKKATQARTDHVPVLALAPSVTPAPAQVPVEPSPMQHPPTPITQALLHAALLAALMSFAWAAVFTNGTWPELARIMFPTIACSWMLLVLERCWPEPRARSGHRRLAQLGIGVLLGLLVHWLDGQPLADLWRPGKGFVYFGLMFLLLRWWKLTDLHRPRFFSFQGVVTTLFLAWALVLVLLYGGLKASPGQVAPEAGFASLVLASVVVQLASPWIKVVVLRQKRHRLPGA